jgi:hypothetical protein
LIQALEALKISEDYRHALLLAFFSIEQVITETLEDIKKKAGIPEKTIKNFRAGEFGISYRINIELPLVFPPDSPVRKLIPDLDKANGYRNAVVHKRRDPAYQKAAFVIKTGDRLIKALSGEPIDVEPAGDPIPPEPAGPLRRQDEGFSNLHGFRRTRLESNPSTLKNSGRHRRSQ